MPGEPSPSSEAAGCTGRLEPVGVIAGLPSLGAAGAVSTPSTVGGRAGRGGGFLFSPPTAAGALVLRSVARGEDVTVTVVLESAASAATASSSAMRGYTRSRVSRPAACRSIVSIICSFRP